MDIETKKRTLKLIFKRQEMGPKYANILDYHKK